LRCVYVLLTTGILKLEEPRMKATTTRVRGTRRPKVSPLPVAEVRNEDAPVENAKPSSGPSAEEEAFLRDVTAKTSAVGKVSHYELLEVPRGATRAEIKSAYLAMVKKFHPDRHQSEPFFGEIQRQLEALLIQYKDAYDVLFDPAQRMKHDKQLAPLPPPSKPAAPAAEGSASALESSSKAGAAFVPPPAFASPVAMAQARYRAGKAHFEEKDYHEAVESLREAVRLAPDNPEYHHLLACALLKNPKWRKQAEKHFTCVIELEPFKTTGYVELAQLYEEGGLATRAKKMYEKVLELDPGHEIAASKLNANSNPVEQLIAKSGFLQRFRGKGHPEGTTGDAEAESRERR
jgi:tetratricopeptide (TPR) repeat protein